MSTMGNIAVEGQMKEILALMEKIKDKPADEQIKIIRKHVKKTMSAAKSGWL